MDLTKKWHRSEFVSHEMLEVHRGIECELDFYSAIANGEIELVQENCNEQAFTNPEGMACCLRMRFAISDIIML